MDKLVENSRGIKNVAILTSGGDAPGMNAVIASIVSNFRRIGNVNEIFLVKDGFNGLIEDKLELFGKEISFEDDILRESGTRIFSGRCPAFYKEEVRKTAIENLRRRGVNFLIVIGGEGSYKATTLIKQESGDINTAFVPASIDNDTPSSYSIGFDTALNTISESIDKIYQTGRSHKRCMIVEIMGNFSGELTEKSAIAAGNLICSTPEQKLSPKEIVEKIKARVDRSSPSAIVILVTEKLYPSPGNFPSLSELARYIQEKTS